MKLKSFRIRNYRSISDSGICNLSRDNVTILAGMNESGKTSILEALEDFDTSREIREEAIPINRKGLEPEIAINFEVEKKVLEELKKELNIQSDTKSSIGIEIIKRYPNNYSISPEEIQKFGIRNEQKAEITQNKNQKNNVQVVEELKKKIPNFILFSSFDDKFPSEINLHSRGGYPYDHYSNSKNDDFIKDLEIVSDLDIKIITSGSPSEKVKHKRKLNLKMNNDYKQYWTQDFSKLYIDWDSDKINFFIEENEEFFSPNQRSKGRQWHLAFYVKVSARSKENVPNVILIDEPGLYLHPKAQKDILKKLEDSARNAPIILSTHSPYLIETDKLHRIRLVSRKGKGTTISEKIHKDADKETLTPIITAIGLDLSLGLDITKDNNIIVEGISDYYYLTAFKEILDFKFKENVHIIPSAGADKFKFLIPMMIGWGLNYCTLLDHDQKGESIQKYLSSKFGDSKANSIFVSENRNEELEDLFEKQDFIKLVLCEDIGKYSGNQKVSQIIEERDGTFDKLLIAKRFYENRNENKRSLTENTKNNFMNLLKKIDEALFKQK